jgi:hypothetical protein
MSLLSLSSVEDFGPDPALPDAALPPSRGD